MSSWLFFKKLFQKFPQMCLPLDVFFEIFKAKHSRDSALRAMQTAIVKRKLHIKSIESKEEPSTVETDFEALWKLICKEKILRRINGQM